MRHSEPTHLTFLPRPLALVLSGGASLGAVHVGQLLALTEMGVRPDFIVGTSVGALNGAFMASEFSHARALSLAAVWRGLRRNDIFGSVGPSALIRLFFGGGAFSSPGGLEALVGRHLPRDMAELEIPAHLVAVDYLSGRTVVLSSGDLHRNVMASAAIPTVFPPVDVGGRLMVDGGVCANVPIGPAAALGARSLIVLDAGYPCMLSAPPRGLVAGILHALSLTIRSQVHATLPSLAPDHTLVYLPSPCPNATPPHDFSQASELMDSGHALARRFLDDLASGEPGVYGHPHTHDDVPAH